MNEIYNFAPKIIIMIRRLVNYVKVDEDDGGRWLNDLNKLYMHMWVCRSLQKKKLVQSRKMCQHVQQVLNKQFQVFENRKTDDVV